MGFGFESLIFENFFLQFTDWLKIEFRSKKRFWLSHENEERNLKFIILRSYCTKLQFINTKNIENM
jgi:hypothetical protein